MHRTELVDYGVVISGEMTLVLDKGEALLREGDVVVQRGHQPRLGEPIRQALPDAVHPCRRPLRAGHPWGDGGLMKFATFDDGSTRRATRRRLGRSNARRRRLGDRPEPARRASTLGRGRSAVEAPLRRPRRRPGRRAPSPSSRSSALRRCRARHNGCDGSAFLNHGRLMDLAFNKPPIPDFDSIPVMYQGASDDFLGPCADVPFVSEADGIDFEGEFGVIVDEVPMGTSARSRGGSHPSHRSDQ